MGDPKFSRHVIWLAMKAWSTKKNNISSDFKATEQLPLLQLIPIGARQDYEQLQVQYPMIEIGQFRVE